MLRHAVATLAYRCSRAVDGAPAEFGSFRAAPKTRTPCEILAHMGDLFDWALQLAGGKHVWHDSPALEWSAAVRALLRGAGSLRPPPCVRRAAGM